jgi:hypothetical protein
MKRPSNLFGVPLKKLPPPPEYQLQIAVASHLRLCADKAWRWTHFPAGEIRDRRTGAKLKAMGLQPGWPDIIAIDPEGKVHFLELKRKGGRLSEEQDRFMAWCVIHAIPYEVADNINDALKVLESWGLIQNATSALRRSV